MTDFFKATRENRLPPPTNLFPFTDPKETRSQAALALVADFPTWDRDLLEIIVRFPSNRPVDRLAWFIVWTSASAHLVRRIRDGE